MKLLLAGATAAVVALSLGTSASSTPTPTPTSGRSVSESPSVLTPCEDLPSLPTAECGTVVVPLDRARPELGTTTVTFAVVPRTDQSRPSLGTIVPNPGGPGSSTIDLSGFQYVAGLAPILKRRELLLMDTRGVGRSDALTCEALAGPTRVFEGLQKQRRLIGECGEQLGSRVSSYGSAAIADDLEDIRVALGIDKLDLFGDSYGTFLMPVYAHRHPSHVRSAVLSGAYAVNIDSGGALGEQALRRAIRLVADRTGTYSANVAINDLKALATRLRLQPTTVRVRYAGERHRVPLNEWQLAGTVARVYSSTPVERTQIALARAARAARTGNLSPIKKMTRAYLRELADAYSRGPAEVSDAALWGTTCHDYRTEFDLADSIRDRQRDFSADVAAQSPQAFGIFSARAWMTRANYDSGACLRWPTDPTAGTPFGPNATLPDIPVLVLSGDLDANTSSASGRQAAAQFPNATWVEVEGAGHSPTGSAAGLQLILEFLGRSRP